MARTVRTVRNAVNMGAFAAHAQRGLWLSSFSLAGSFGLTPLADAQQRDLLELLDDRYDKSATLVTSQLPIDRWHAYLGDPTLADAILDRLVYNAHRVVLKGGSMRVRRARDLPPEAQLKENPTSPTD